MPQAAVAAVAIIGAVISAVGTLYTVQQQQAMADYNEKVARQNAQMAEDKANYDARMHNQEVQRMLATQRSLYGISGVSSESGSPLLVMADSVKQGAMDSLAIKYGGNVEAAKQRSAAAMYRMQGDAAMTAGMFSAGSSLLSGLSGAMKG